MIAHFFTLEALAAELRPVLTGAVLEETYTQSKHELLATLTLREGGERTLVLSLAPGLNAWFLREGRMRAKRNSTDIFPEAAGSTISWVSVDRFSRVAVIEAGRFRLRAHLFNNASANAFLVDSAGTVAAAFTDSASFAGRPYRPGGADAGLADPLDAGELRRALERPDTSLERALKSCFPWLGPVYQREALHRAGLDGTAAAASPGAGAAEALTAAIGGLLADVRAPRPALYAGVEKDRDTLSVVPLRHLPGGPSREFPSVNDGVRECFSARRREEGLDEAKADLLEALQRERRRTEKALKEARSRAQEESAAGEHRRKGTILLTHLHRVRKGDAEARLPDADGSEVTIRLDRALTPAANANLWFDRARKAETAREENEARAGSLAEKLVGIDALLAELDAAADLRSVRDLRNAMRSGRGAPVALDDGERLPYRVFPIGERYEAWVGKSSSDNDELTFRHAGPHDWWMHVRGSPGSHVVLRSRSGGAFDPPREVLRAAAKIAAYYSKMKNAGTVPVAYCERKYVKKPKHAPPGTVTLQREEVIFVEPGLPGKP